LTKSKSLHNKEFQVGGQRTVKLTILENRLWPEGTAYEASESGDSPYALVIVYESGEDFHYNVVVKNGISFPRARNLESILGTALEYYKATEK